MSRQKASKPRASLGAVLERIGDVRIAQQIARERRAALLEAVEGGLSQSRAAAELGVSRQRVCAMVKQARQERADAVHAKPRRR